MLDELAARGGLQAALAGRGPVQLLPLLHHITRHIADPRHSSSLAGVIARLLELYAPVVHTSAEASACCELFCVSSTAIVSTAVIVTACFCAFSGTRLVASAHCQTHVHTYTCALVAERPPLLFNQLTNTLLHPVAGGCCSDQAV